MEKILNRIQELTLTRDKISPELIKEKNIKLGLRNPDGTGVAVGITTKGKVIGYDKSPEGKKIPAEGKLYYCGFDVGKIVDDVKLRNSFGFEEIAYLLLAGELPNQKYLSEFSEELAERRFLSKQERSVIMEEVVNENQMYALHSVISHLGKCDSNPESLDLRNVSRQCIDLIAKFPTIVAYNYNVAKFKRGSDLKMVRPMKELSTAENFLYMLKGEIPDKTDAHLFDIALILHAEHGGGNNSTFTVRSVSSSGANTYAAIAAGIASLSVSLHGGANEYVMKMMRDLKRAIKDWSDEKAISQYINDVLDKKIGDRSGKVYGLGHAVYTYSDPRAVILRGLARDFAHKKNASEEFLLYETVDRLGSKILSERKGVPINVNVDFYSGFIYRLMGIPQELYTPIFAMSRVAGWSAHRLEQIVQSKIMRPVYIGVNSEELASVPYTSLSDRE